MIAFAQAPNATTRATKMTDVMDCEVRLTAKQYPIIYLINLEACMKMDSIFKSSNNVDVIVKSGKKVDKIRNISLRDVLDFRQFSIYERISKGNKRMLRKSANCRKSEPQTF